MIKRNVLKNGESDVNVECDDNGRWIIMKIKNLVDDMNEVMICGLYASTDPTQRVKWMKEMGERMREIEGYKLIAGDFNFVMNTKIDIGKKIQESGEGN